MATYYKYAERSADSQVNWAEVGKGISDMLKEETAIREQKKAAIDQATREFQKTLENAPQGQFQDANKFTNDYAHSMMEQQMIDNRLLKSGQMKLQDFTYRRQNYVDGTSTLFDLQKLYQDNYKSKMEGIQSGELQPLTGANMASVEGFADFSKSKAVIDPTTGVVNVGIMKPNATTGVMELTNDVAPVNVIKGKILANIPAFKVEDAMNSTVKVFGDRIETLYDIATKTKAGTITKLTGIGALEAAKNPQFKTEIDLFNKAIDETITSYFADPYHLSSVLTMQVGKYDATSFTYDKDVAAKDPTKLLLKINPSTGLGILDESGANYKVQEKEARDWVRTQLLAKMDSKKEMQETGTIPYGPQPQQWQYQAGQDKKNELAAAGAWNQLYTGKTAAEKQAAADILLGTPQAQAQGLLGIDLSAPGSVKLSYADPKKNRSIAIWDANKKPISLYDFAGKGVELHGVVDRQQAVKAGGGGTGYGALTDADWKTVKSSRTGVAAEAPVVNILPELFSIRSGPSTKSLQNLLGPTFKVTDKGGTWGNDVEVTAPNGQKFTYNANLKKDEAAVAKADLEQFIKVNGAPVGNTGGGGVNYGDK
jgi:hypothetical protein